jgi:hypothetical protein
VVTRGCVFDERDRLARSCPDRRVLIGMRIAWSKHGLRQVKSRNWSLKNPSRQGTAAGHGSVLNQAALTCELDGMGRSRAAGAFIAVLISSALIWSR